MDGKDRIGRYVILGMLALVLLGGVLTFLYGLAGGLN
jgi:hypothetical protein